MSRSLARLLLVVATLMTSLVLVAGAAMAADETTEGGEESAATETGFGTSDFDALIVAAAAGLAFGVVVFATSSPGDIEKAGHH